MTAAFKLPCMRFPKSCAAVEELGREEQERQRGRLKHLCYSISKHKGSKVNSKFESVCKIVFRNTCNSLQLASEKL